MFSVYLKRKKFTKVAHKFYNLYKKLENKKNFPCSKYGLRPWMACGCDTGIFCGDGFVLQATVFK